MDIFYLVVKTRPYIPLSLCCAVLALLYCLENNLNASRTSEHPPVREKTFKMSKRLCGTIGCKDQTSSLCLEIQYDVVSGCFRTPAAPVNGQRSPYVGLTRVGSAAKVVLVIEASGLNRCISPKAAVVPLFSPH